jgi:hypothetical protein
MPTIEALTGFIAILALDFKGDFVDIASRRGRDIWDHYSALDGFRLGCGPPLECINQPSWLSHFTKIIAAHCGLKYSESVLASVMRIALRLLNPTGQIVIWPSLLLIEQLLDILPTHLIARKGDYKRPVQQKIEYIRRTSGSLFEAERGFDIFEHLIRPRRCAVVMCTMLSELQTQILVNLLALQFLFTQITLRRVSKQTVFALIVDESDPVCSREASIVYPEGYSYLAQYLKQARQFGGVGILGVNFLGQCSRFITANVGCHVILNQSDAASGSESARTLLEPSAQQLVSSFPPGHAVFKEAMGPVPYGMPLKLDHVPASELGCPDTFDRHPYTAARGIDEIPGFRDRLEAFMAEHRATVRRQRTKHDERPFLSKTARTFIDQMSLHQHEPLDVVFSYVGRVAVGTQKKIVDTLVRKGLIEAKTVRTGRSWTRFGRIKEKGWQYLGKTSRYAPLRGGVVHTSVCYLKQRLDLQSFEKSFCEHQLEGSTGFHDVVSIKDGKYYVSEVVIDCDKNVPLHARDCFVNSTTPAETLTIVTLLKSQHQKIRDRILEDPELVFFVGRVTFLTVEDILKELYR